MGNQDDSAFRRGWDHDKSTFTGAGSHRWEVKMIQHFEGDGITTSPRLPVAVVTRQDVARGVWLVAEVWWKA